MSGSADGLTDCVRLLPGPDLLVFPAGPDASVHWSRNTDYYKVVVFFSGRTEISLMWNTYSIVDNNVDSG